MPPLTLEREFRSQLSDGADEIPGELVEITDGTVDSIGWLRAILGILKKSE